MRRLLSVVGLSLALAACVTPTSGPTAPVGAGIPSSPISYGDWRNATVAATTQFFEHEISSRYRAGLTLATVNSDLRRNDFTCANNRDVGGRGDPPDQICRKTVTLQGCTHTWQVHLYDADGNGELARSRALYDRRCGSDGLLGGPG